MKQRLAIAAIFLNLGLTPLFGQTTPQPAQDASADMIVNDMQRGTYILKGIVIDGVQRYTPEEVLRFTGFQKGESVELPGQKISTAVRKLWDTDLFSAVEVYVEDIKGAEVTLRFVLKDLKEVGEVKVERTKGVSKSDGEKILKDNNLKSGTKITDNLIANLKQRVPKEYINKGFADARLDIQQIPNPTDPQKVDLVLSVDRGKRVRIHHIEFEGNQAISDRKLRNNAFKDTKQKRFIIGIFKPSRFIQEKYEEDKKNLVNYYNSLGYRDMKIVEDKVWRDEKGYNINVKLEEGKQYYIGDITFVGNTKYSSEVLGRILGYKKGDIYDAVGFAKKVGEDGGKEDDSDLKSLYMNEGYLFSQVTPVEKSVEGNVVNLEVRIREGEKAAWNRVTWSGNTTTHDHVILRSLRTKPGNLFSKSDIKRTYMDLAGMSFFDPQQLGQNVVPSPQDNTVDIHWTLVEKGSSTVQLQAGYGGNSFLGTLGLTFNNFSLKKFLKFEDFRPIPQGDGQVLNLQAQAGQFFQNYTLGFTEPWLFGSRPTSFSFNINNSIMSFPTPTGDRSKLNIFAINTGLNRLLNWPDNYFSLYTGLAYQRYDFNNYDFDFGNQQVRNGTSQTVSLNVSLSRNSAGFDPMFPTHGSNIEISGKFTPPLSLFNNRDYKNMPAEEKYRWMEFYKIKMKADVYNTVVGKLVLRGAMEMGFMNGYNKSLGAPPFERFYVGGIGLYGGRFDGRELIPLRGYENASQIGGQQTDITPQGGATIYNRFTAELRYPISMSQTAKIYALGFVEGGNTWNSFSTYNPFVLKRSAGVGIRVFMGAFGLLGFDFAYGFDPTIGGQIPGWKNHFIMNQNL